MARGGRIEAGARMGAFGAKRTCGEGRKRLGLTQMTHPRHRSDRNPAAQQAPAVAEVCYPFGRKHGRYRVVKRREFIALLGGAGAWPVAARSQQSDKLPTIGFLGAAPSIEGQRVAAFVQRPRELAWIDGRNLSRLSIAGRKAAMSA